LPSKNNVRAEQVVTSRYIPEKALQFQVLLALDVRTNVSCTWNRPELVRQRRPTAPVRKWDGASRNGMRVALPFALLLSGCSAPCPATHAVQGVDFGK